MRSFPKNTWRRGLLAVVLPLAVAGGVRADEVTEWHEHMLDALGNAGVNPIVSTREAALVSAAVFDAVNGIERRYAPIHVAADAPRGASKRAAAVQAAYVILVSRFPAQADDLNDKRDASLAAIGGGRAQSVRRGITWGQTVAEAILEWRSTDTVIPAPVPVPYFGGDAPGQWRPTSFTPTGAVPGAAPHFATMTPWGIESLDQFRPVGPLALDSDQYLMEFLEVRDWGSVDSDLRSEDQTDACRFAAASSATYLWNRLALDLLAGLGDEDDGGPSLSDNARLLARLNLAIADALISCWDAKYFYEFWRPVTAIRLADFDGDGNLDDPNWTPLITTPSFPEHTSGHSSLSGAAATVLAAYFGDDTPFLLEAQPDPDWVRFFPSFSAAIDEIGDARVFAGIHFRTACDIGALAGSDVAGFILENRMQRVHGDGDEDDQQDD